MNASLRFWIGNRRLGNSRGTLLALRCVTTGALQGLRSARKASALKFVLLSFLAWAPSRSSQSVTLAWDPNSDLDLAGYKLYYGVAHGSYSNTVDVGNVTTNTLSDLAPGVTYFFVVTAYNSNRPAERNQLRRIQRIPH